MANWSAEDSKMTYNLSGWSEDYVDVHANGHLLLRPYRDQKGGEIDLKLVLDDLKKQDIALPVLIRFQDILKDRVNLFCEAFESAFKHNDFDSTYTSIYPIKVNQQFSVVSEIINHGDSCVGLEAGSKPELMAVLSLADTNKHTVICNGYKDREYIRLALIAQQLGHKIFIVIEKLSEIEIVLEQAKQLNVEPRLGLRLKLSSIGKGKWQNTGGESAKFGLTAEQILTVINQLKGKTDWIQLLHFHMGSQIANLSDIKTGLSEAAQYFIELHKLGININTLDVGGGVGVDYEGSSSKSEYSVNYDLKQYADAVVSCFSKACNQWKIKNPAIMTEAGRAMTAHHAVLVTEVINAELLPVAVSVEQPDTESEIIAKAYSLYEDSNNKNPIAVYQELNNLYQQTQQAFNKNTFSISDRVLFGKIYLACCRQLKNQLDHADEEQQCILNTINEKLADKLVCNMSVFQSLPDIWGISQIFPIVPLQYLNKKPDRRAIIQDLTCDSDGQIKQYVDRYGIETTLSVHRVEDNDRYLLGVFMVGAYQEILGDMHNLFGDTNTVNVELDKNKQYHLTDFEKGDTVRELLNYVHFDTDKMKKIFQNKVEAASLSPEVASQFMSELFEGLEGYTYLEKS